MARIDPLRREDMNEDQGRLYDKAVSRGGRTGGPNGINIRVPELFTLHQNLGNYVRDNHLDPRLRQLATLVAVRRWNARYAWATQARFSLEAGISRETVDTINARETPALNDPTDRLVYDVATELADRGTLSDGLFEKAKAQLGLNPLIDLVAAVGYFTALSLTLNAFEVDTKPDFTEKLAQ